MAKKAVSSKARITPDSADPFESNASPQLNEAPVKPKKAAKKTAAKKAATKKAPATRAKKSIDAETETGAAEAGEGEAAANGTAAKGRRGFGRAGAAKGRGGKSNFPARVYKAPTIEPGKNLIIVESPAKARTIERYLGDDYKVMASIGHVIDLPAAELGVDVENNFTPDYVVIKGKQPVLDALKKQAKVSKRVYLAPDPDREGEAIAHHIAEVLKGTNPDIQRATFNEITKTAVKEAIEHPRAINDNLFNAQQARRVLDRLVGYKLSPLLWKKVRRGLSAGRVQSVAVRLVCDREREIRIFVPVEYWSIDGRVEASQPPPFDIHLDKIDGKKADITNQAQADEILAAVKGKPFVISQVTKKEVSKRPFAPFITSTLQQEASRKLRLPAARTMSLAQKLYEGMELGDLGHVGLITYMRTDSVRFSDEAIRNIREQIGGQFGKNYVPDAPRVYSTKKNAQDAHEAIRPTDISLTPEKVAKYLDPQMLDLYTLIWRRAMASQMIDAKLERTRVEIEIAPYLFVATGSIVKFDGYMRVYQEAKDESGKSESDAEGAEPLALDEDEMLPPLEEGMALTLQALNGNQHFTQPPPRYTEAGLIKELEKQGIGRPSTYAAIISVIQDKEYATKESGTFRPTDLGFMITDMLMESFPHIMDVKFTAAMEDQLDHVEDGSVNWVELLRNFYTPFAVLLEEAGTKMRNVKAEVVPTEHICDKCGRAMVIRWGRNGKFLACSGFPACRNTKPIVEDAEGNVTVAPQETTDTKCPNCGKPMAVKSGRHGKFLACTGYPECKTTMPYLIGVPCPREGCGGELVERRSARGLTFYSCNNYPACRVSVFEKPYKEKCEVCNQEHWFVGEGPKKKSMSPDPTCTYPKVPIKDGTEAKEEGAEGAAPARRGRAKRS